MTAPTERAAVRRESPRLLARPATALLVTACYLLALLVIAALTAGSVVFLGAGVGMPLGDGASVVTWADVAPAQIDLLGLGLLLALVAGVLWIPAAIVVTLSPLWRRGEVLLAWVCVPIAAMVLLVLLWGALELSPPDPGPLPFVAPTLALAAFAAGMVGEGRRGVARARLRGSGLVVAPDTVEPVAPAEPATPAEPVAH